MTGIEVAAAAALVSGVVGAVGAVSQANAEADALSSSADIQEFNAQVAENDAIAARQSAEFEESRQRRRDKRILASQKAAFGAAGVTAEGSPLTVIQDSAEEGEIDALAIRYSGSIQEARAKSAAAAERASARATRVQAKNTRSGGLAKAGTSLLTGVSGVASSGILDG